MKKISFKFIALAMALSICFSVVYSDYTYAIDLPKFVYDDEKTWQYNAINMISIGCAVGGLFVGPMTPWGTALEGTAVISELFLRVMDANGWGDKPKEEQEELMKDYLKTAVTYNISTKQYTISDSFNDDLHIVVNKYLEETTGYITIPTVIPEDIPGSYFSTSVLRQNFIDLVSSFDVPIFINYYKSDGLYAFYGGYNFLPTKGFSTWYNIYSGKKNNTTSSDLSGYYLNEDNLSIINEDWSTSKIIVFCPKHNSLYQKEDCDCTKRLYYNLSTNDFTSKTASNNGSSHHFYADTCFFALLSSEREFVKVWKSIDSYKEYDIGHQPYYASQEWNNYDYSQDNSQTYSESFIDNSIKDSNNNTTYNEIVNNTTNGMTEKEVADLVETIMKNQKEINNTPPSSGGDNTGGGSSSGGSGLGALLDGIGSIFDFIGTLIGNIIGFIADLLKTTMDSISSVTGSLGGLGDAFASVFSFLPPEVIGIITGGLSLMITLGIIKFLLK